MLPRDWCAADRFALAVDVQLWAERNKTILLAFDDRGELPCGDAAS